MALLQFATDYGKYAVEAGQTFRFNPAVILAVASWESAYGSSANAKRYNNFFGIKEGTTRKSPFSNGQKHPAPDGGYYLHYDNPAQSFRDFLHLLSYSSRYRHLLAMSYDVDAFAAAFVNSGYMTDPQRWNTYRPAIISRANQFTPLLSAYAQPASFALGGILVAGLCFFLTKRYLLTP